MNFNKETSHLEAQEKKIFSVKKIQLKSNIDRFENPSSFGIYKSDGGKALGVVGKSFTPVQPRKIYESFLEAIIILNISPDNFYFKEYFNGSKINFQLQLLKDSFINKQGKKDDIIYQLDVITGFDGQTKLSASLSSMRLICSNGMRIKENSYSISHKNTSNNANNVYDFIDNISKSLKDIEKVAEYNKFLNSIVIKKNNTIEDFKYYVLNIDKNDTDISTRSRNKLYDFDFAINKELDRTGNTLFGLLNGATYYSNHMAKNTLKTKQDKEEYIYFQNGDKLNQRAQNFVNNLTEA